MQSNLAQLSKEQHRNVKIKANSNFKHIATHHMAPVIVHEIANAAADLPIVFVKNSQSGDFLCVILMGLKEKENLMVGEDGQWLGGFIPAGYTHFPLALVPHPEDDKKYSITISTDSDCVSEEEGSPLYNEDGSESEFLSKRRKALENYYGCAVMTRDFVKAMVDSDLLEPQEISFTVGEDKRNVTGIHIISEKKLAEISDEKFIEFRKKGYLLPIHAHLISLKQMQRLIHRIPVTKA